MEQQRPLITAKDLEERPNRPIPENALLTPLAQDLLRKRGIRPRPAAGGSRKARRLLIANWKSHKTIPEALTFAQELRAELETAGGKADLVVCPPSTVLASLIGPLRGLAELGAQDVSAYDEGAHTGELAPRHLVDAGCAYAIVGHSERRLAGETDDLCRTKVRTALRGGLQPILCVGETAEERTGGRAQAVVSEQLRAVCSGLSPAQARQLVVAYEPRWAIGTGVTPTEDEVQTMIAHVRSVLERCLQPEAARGISVLYGGSVKPANAASLMHLPGCSGALVGGASLKAKSFVGILRCM